MSSGGTAGEQPVNGLRLVTARPVGRRAFLAGSAAAAVALAAGCSGSDSVGTAGTDGSAGVTTGPALGPTTTLHTAKLAGDPFGLGVASGDPALDSVILWTRLAPDPLALDAKGGMPADRVDVIWEVAADDRFRNKVASGVATASADFAHALHVEATGLEPGVEYHYRFTVGEWTSPTGRTRTLPDGSPDRFRLAVANCQWREAGRYAAYRDMAEQDFDLVLHLGDYIYEFAGTAEGDRATLPTRQIETLDDYRLRYASYRLDEHLQAAHARFPFVCTWDDHEVANNYMGDVLPGSEDLQVGKDRKAAAYRAWWENIPTRLQPPAVSDLTVYQSVDIGDLARLVVLDERQDSDVPPCRGEATAAGDTGDCADRLDEDRTRLGPEQESFVASQLSGSTATWTLLGNPVVLAGVDAGGDESAYYLDVWDGFPQARLRLIEQLAGTSNPVVLTGDYHAGMVLDVHRTPFDQSSAVVAPEFMAPPISSPLFSADISGRTPQLRQQINAHGYLAVDLTPDLLTATFKTVTDVSKADSPVTTAATWTVDPGNPVATQA